MSVASKFFENKTKLLLAEGAVLLAAGCTVSALMGQNAMSMAMHGALMATGMTIMAVPIALDDRGTKSRARKLALAAACSFMFSQAIQNTSPNSEIFLRDKVENVQPK